ncbi:MAG: histidine--tRNA ligase [Candidatus Margulisiibacteriota bacterium]
MTKYAAPRGTKDILPAESSHWQMIETACRKVFELYNYKEIRTPIFESTELFTRSIGQTTDIVGKEMYEFKDRKGRSLCLRPEATAPVVRACIENNLLSADQTTKLFYIGPMFRYERPQAGRQRQFHQAGVEVFGSNEPRLDAEVIALNLQLLSEIGLKDLEVDINSVGCANCRPAYREKLRDYLKANIKDMCSDCQDRFEKNPLRVLDCKEAKCQKYIENAPASSSMLCVDCSNHFKQMVGWLDGLMVKYKINNRLVRGLDYYTKTTFEIVSNKLGAQNAVSGGGRYDGLVEELGGKPTPAVGFAVGLERIIGLLSNYELRITSESKTQLYIATIGDEATIVGFEMMQKARSHGISADMDYLGKSLKSQMKAADRAGAKFVYIIGDEEIKKQSAVLKNMQTSSQEEVAFDLLLEKAK